MFGLLPCGPLVTKCYPPNTVTVQFLGSDIKIAKILAWAVKI